MPLAFPDGACFALGSSMLVSSTLPYQTFQPGPNGWCEEVPREGPIAAPPSWGGPRFPPSFAVDASLDTTSINVGNTPTPWWRLDLLQEWDVLLVRNCKQYN